MLLAAIVAKVVVIAVSTIVAVGPIVAAVVKVS